MSGMQNAQRAALAIGREFMPWMAWGATNKGARGEVAYGTPDEVVVYLEVHQGAWRAWGLSARTKDSLWGIVDRVDVSWAILDLLVMWPGSEASRVQA